VNLRLNNAAEIGIRGCKIKTLTGAKRDEPLQCALINARLSARRAPSKKLRRYSERRATRHAVDEASPTPPVTFAMFGDQVLTAIFAATKRVFQTGGVETPFFWKIDFPGSVASTFGVQTIKLETCRLSAESRERQKLARYGIVDKCDLIDVDRARPVRRPRPRLIAYRQ
jgi:hypothetical protein